MSAPPTDFPPFGDDEFPRYAPPARRLPEIPGIQPLDEPPRWGGFGTVFKATETVLNRTVAVKVEHQRSEGVAEAVQLARYQHPNIVTVHGTGITPDGHRYVVLEWLSGGSLAERLGSGARLSPRGWAELFEKVALAVDAVHTAGAIHRDIKPHNILFACHGPNEWFRQPKLADFGLAVTGTVLSDGSGTRAYMAPEQRAGNPTRFSDVYSLGLTLWQCLTRMQPPKGGNIPNPLPMRGIPKTLAAIVAKCLSEQPRDRYGSSALDIADPRQRPALGLASDLRRFLAHEPTQARPLHTFQRIALWVRREPWQAIALAALGTGFVASTWFAYHESDARQQVEKSKNRLHDEMEAKLTKEREASEANGNLAIAMRRELAAKSRADVLRYASQLKQVQEYLAASKSAEAVAALDGCDPQLRGWEWDYLRGQCDTALSQCNFPSAVEAIAVGADGQVAIAVRGGEVFVGPIHKGQPRTPPLRELPTREFQRAFFAGDWLVTTSSTKRGSVTASVIDFHPLTSRTSIAPIRELFVPGDLVQNAPAPPAQFSDDTLVFLGGSGTLKTLRGPTGQVRLAMKDFPRATAIAFWASKSDPLLAAIVGDTVRFWTWPKLEPTPALEAQRGRLLDLAFTADGTLALLNEASEVSLWSFDRGWKLARQQPSEQRKGVTRIIANPNANSFVTIGRTLTAWGPGEGGFRCRDLLGHKVPLTAATFSQDGRRLLSGDGSGEVREFNVLPGAAIPLTFASEIDEPEHGVTAGVVGQQLVFNGRAIGLGDQKPIGLRLGSGREMSTTRLLVETDQRRVVVVDLETLEVVFITPSSSLTP